MIHVPSSHLPAVGFNGVLMSILMYARKLYRNQSVHYSVPAITYNNLPLLLIAFQVITTYTPDLPYIGGIRLLSHDLIFSVISLFFSWSYLRFYFKFSDSIEYGDKSEEFAFVMMFPEVLIIMCTTVMMYFTPTIDYSIYRGCTYSSSL
jgi:hypothetical protein